MYQFFPTETTASFKTYFHKSYEQQLLATIFPLISAAPLGIHIERGAFL